MAKFGNESYSVQTRRPMFKWLLMNRPFFFLIRLSKSIKKKIGYRFTGQHIGFQI